VMDLDELTAAVGSRSPRRTVKRNDRAAAAVGRGCRSASADCSLRLRWRVVRRVGHPPLMLTILIIVLLICALAGGVVVHPLLFALALIALVLLLSDRRRPPPAI
jgi:hypothetical protein